MIEGEEDGVVVVIALPRPRLTEDEIEAEREIGIGIIESEEVTVEIGEETGAVMIVIIRVIVITGEILRLQESVHEVKAEIAAGGVPAHHPRVRQAHPRVRHHQEGSRQMLEPRLVEVV